MTGWGSTALQGKSREEAAARYPQPRLRDPGSGDPRVSALRTAVAGLHRALADYRAQLPDRETAEEQLLELNALLGSGVPEPARLRQVLLLILAALGSVSALAEPLAELRVAIGRFGAPARRG